MYWRSLLAAISAVMLLKLHKGIAWTLAISGGLALAAHVAGISGGPM